MVFSAEGMLIFQSLARSCLSTLTFGFTLNALILVICTFLFRLSSRDLIYLSYLDSNKSQSLRQVVLLFAILYSFGYGIHSFADVRGKYRQVSHS
jgi:hypothetical protein